jgi:hypothetical protein
MFTDVGRVKDARHRRRSRRNPEISTRKKTGFSAVERSPKSTNVTDVGRSRKSAVFSHVNTAPGLERRAGGPKWMGGFWRSGNSG